MRLTYICHPFSGDETGNQNRVAELCRTMRRATVPLAPQLLLPWFLEESGERDLAMRHCLRLVAAADQVWVYGEQTAGMKREVAEAHRLGIPVERRTSS